MSQCVDAADFFGNFQELLENFGNVQERSETIFTKTKFLSKSLSMLTLFKRVMDGANSDEL